MGVVVAVVVVDADSVVGAAEGSAGAGSCGP